MQTFLNYVILYMIGGLLASILMFVLAISDFFLFVCKKRAIQQFLSGEILEKIQATIDDVPTHNQFAELVMWPIYRPIYFVHFHKYIWSLDV